MGPSFYELPFEDLKSWLRQRELSEYGANVLFKSLYKFKGDKPGTPEVAKNTSLALEELDFSLPQIVQAKESADGTVKFLLQLYDQQTIETVIIPFQGKYSLCVSSQVGCAMKCSFCYTGTMGLKRNLKTSEIIGQYLVAWKWLQHHRPGGKKIRNIVFMGQGEPLHNFDAVQLAAKILIDQRGMSVGIQRITISTSGYLPGLQRWVEEMPPVNIALSLHAVDATKRSELIPINKNYPLADVLALLKAIPLQRKQFITYEYLLIDQFNDSLEEAHELAQLLKDHQSIINIIPFNPFPGSKYKRPSIEKTQAFHAVLTQYRIPSFIRSTKGDEILAACGQLNTSPKD
jgi:23S rRNA (adenine2503-C2)-methyltransferase